MFTLGDVSDAKHKWPVSVTLGQCLQTSRGNLMVNVVIHSAIDFLVNFCSNTPCLAAVPTGPVRSSTDVQ